MIVQQLLHEHPDPLLKTDSISTAVLRFAESDAGVAHLPIIDEHEQFVGTLAKNQIQGQLPGLPITSFLHVTPIRSNPDMHVFELANLFRMHDQDLLPVVDKDDIYLGLVFRTDVFNCLSHMLTTHKQGAILEIEMAARDYTLGQLVYIIEQNDAKILSITSDLESVTGGTAHITLKLNIKDASRIRHVLGHYGYHVANYFDASTAADLQFRVQELMRYLEV